MNHPPSKASGIAVALFQKYNSLDTSLYIEHDAIIEKYRKYKLVDSTKNFAALTNGAISVEELLKHVD